MADAQPSLGELTSIKPEANINPIAILDSRDAVHQLNQSAQFNAEMKQKKYAQQLEMLNGLYQDLGKIQETPVMEQDKPQLNKMMGDILNTIGKDTHKALGGPGFNDIQKQLGQLRSMATESKHDNMFHDFQQKSIQSDPSFSTPGNKAKPDKFASQPLGHRTKELLDMPVSFDVEKFANGLLKSPQIGTPYLHFGTEGENNEFITKTTGTKYGKDKFLGAWDQGYYYQTTNNGQPVKQWVQEQFDNIKNDPSALERLGNPKTPEELWQNMGKTVFGSNEDIIADKQGTRTQNPYAFEAMKERERLHRMGVKFGYDKALEGMRLGRSEALEVFKKSLKDKTKKEQTGALNGMVDTMVNNALLKERDESSFDKSFFGDDLSFKMDVSAPTLNAFSKLKNIGGKTEKVAPDEMAVSKDGKTVKAIFNIKSKEPDVQTFSIDEFKVRFGKDVLGVSATEKEINDAGDEQDGIQPVQTTITPHAQSSSKKPKLY